MSFFQESIKKKYLNELDNELIDNKYKQFCEYFHNKQIQQNIRNSKEEQFQEGFLRELFVNIFGYTLNPHPEFNLTTELKNIANSKKVDGAILKNGDAIAVIELKGTDTSELDKVESQAFGYKSHNPKCIYVITSNFEKIRFYIQNAVEHINFNLFDMSREQFAMMWICLAKVNLLNDIPLKMKESSLMQEENITKKLYADYSKFRETIYTNLVKNNPEHDKLLLFKKTQKLLDRFLFVFFAEDRLLIPPNSIREIINQWKILKEELDDYMPLYARFKKFFGYLNTGFKGKNYEIFAYNGGLFAPDEILDNISIDDNILFEHTSKLSQYDFDTEVDVNILGHIFEHSLGEIESVQAEIKGETVETQKSKRKKDGIFYTPKYITKYIVENTVGKLCIEKRAEFGIIDEEYAKGRKNRKKEEILALDKKLTDYRNWLLNITILDPACGSGAFLNQALDFLIVEHRKIDHLRAALFEEGLVFADITSDILENNIYGVDINEESVEIAKLSLWLRTAQIGRKLNSLSNNIKCGNSLIDDPAVAGDKAFNWEKEFPQVFKENPPNPLEKGEQDSEFGFIPLSKGEQDNEFGVIPLSKGEQDNEFGVIPLSKGEQDNEFGVIPLSKGEQDNEFGVIPLSKGESKGDCISGDCLSDDWSFMRDWIIKRGLIYSQYHLPYNPKLIDRAKELRKNMTEPEKKLWFNFLNKFQFRVLRQRTIDNYIVDFYIAEVKLAIEIDGDSHFSDDGIEYDNTRTEILNHYGIKVIRFNNSDVMNNLEGVCNAISNEVEKLHLIKVKSNYQTEDIQGLMVGDGNPDIDTNPQSLSPNPKNGFDVVIGNPPWGAKLAKDDIESLLKSFSEISAGEIDTYIIFMIKGLKVLKFNGYLGYIVPDTWLSLQRTNNLRKYIYDNSQIIDIYDRYKPFEDAKDTRSHSIILRKEINIKDKYIFSVKISDSKFNVIKDYNLDSEILMNFKEWNLYKSNEENDIFQKMIRKSVPLKDLYNIKYGLRTGDNNKYLSKIDVNGLGLRIARGSHIQRYYFNWTEEYLISKEGLPSSYFEPNTLKKKIIIQRIRTNSTDLKSRWLESTIVNEDNYLALDSTTFIFEKGDLKLEYLLTILSSYLMNFYYKAHYTDVNVKPIYLEKLPIPNISTEAQFPFIALADNMLEMNKELKEKENKFIELLKADFNIEKPSTKLENWIKVNWAEFEKELNKIKITLSGEKKEDWFERFNRFQSQTSAIKSEIDKTDKKIDQLVYQLYELTEEEIKVVEGE